MKKLTAYAVLLVVVIVLIFAYTRQGVLAPEETASSLVEQLAAAGLEPAVLAEPLDESLVREAQAAIDRAVAWLAKYQSEDGSWSNKEFPALTALPLWAILRSGTQHPDTVAKAVEFIVSNAHEDGGIWAEPSEERKGGGMANYNTALCMVALHETGLPELAPYVERARSFIAKSQHFGDDLYHGGMGYDAKTGRAYADLSNSYIAYEAMALTEKKGDQGPEVAHGTQDDLNWEAAIDFIERVQNRTESNDQDWASDDPKEKGGFAYDPTTSKAGSYTNEAGNVRLRSYGSMTYAGMLSFIYANVDPLDPRVTSAYDWATQNWNVNENPGMGQEGLYYYYQTMAKALSVIGKDVITKKDGTNVNWRQALVKKLLSLQRIDPSGGLGYWKNDEGRWWEADPVLTTSYALLALEMAIKM